MSKKAKPCRNFLCTKNNPTIPTRDYLESLYEKTKAIYVCGQLEKGEEGTEHIQFFVNFNPAQRPSKIQGFDRTCHIEYVHKDNGASDYCLKEETRIDGPFEFGKKPLQRNKETDWEEVWNLAKAGKIEDIPKDIAIRCYSSLSKITKDFLKWPERNRIQAFWIWGTSGCGKSTLAHEIAKNNFGGVFYPKKRNKWWDGYQGEELVIMDDIDKYNVELGGDLKDWADRYPLHLENKGGGMAAKFEMFIVTSQYPIEKIWDKDSETVAALKRRFRIVEWQNGEILIEPPKETKKPEFTIEILKTFKLNEI